MAFRKKSKRVFAFNNEEPHYSPPAQANRRGCQGSLLLFAFFSSFPLMVLSGLIILVVVLVVRLDNLNPVDTVKNLFGFDSDAKQEEVDSRTVVLSIQNLAVLETVESGIEITETVVDRSAAPDATLKVTYIGTIQAGIDLSMISEDAVIISPDQSLTVVLPPTQFTHCDLGKPDIHSWDCRGWFGTQNCTSRRTSTEAKAYDLAMAELLETANELDLLTLATQNAQATLFDLLKKLGFEQVKFEVSADPAPPVDETCLVG